MAPDLSPAGPQAHGGALPAGLLQHDHGVYLDPAATGATLLAAVDHVYSSQAYFVGLDYAVLMHGLYGIDQAPSGAARVAAGVALFGEARRQLYQAPKMGRGYAEYGFGPLYLEAEELPDGSVLPERPARLDVDEFAAAMWLHGIRYGLDLAAVAAAIASGKPERITIAMDLEPVPGQDAMVVEVSQDLHRSNAPRERADGRVDLLSFQNRYPQIKQGMRLLKKQPAVPGLPGIDMAGRITMPAPPRDLELRFWAGEGTAAEQHEDGEYLVSLREGFLSVDPRTSRISITDKIVSLEGVSGRTTGNLELKGAYEEYGDVQELRELTGGDITVHGHVYGHIVSRGGMVVLDRNLVGGSVHGAGGEIHIKGVASGAVVQASAGKVVIARAENCVIAAPQVEVEHAVNCEIAADQLRIGVAEGCAVAGRLVEIDSCGPRKRAEMLVYALVKDVARHDREIAGLEGRLQALQRAIQSGQAELERIAALPDVRRYLALAARLRSQELQVTADQARFLRTITAAVAPQMQAMARIRQELQAAQADCKVSGERLSGAHAQRLQAAGAGRCTLKLVSGDVIARTMPSQDEAPLYLLPPRDIQQRLRGAPSGELLFAAALGALDWHLDLRRAAPPAQDGTA
ncbi:flagellar assembly protein A [Oxalobacteraceae bacterium A2-2]